MKKAHKNRSKKQNGLLDNTKMIYKARDVAIKFYDDYSSIVSDAKNQAIKENKGTGLKY